MNVAETIQTNERKDLFAKAQHFALVDAMDISIGDARDFYYRR